MTENKLLRFCRDTLLAVAACVFALIIYASVEQVPIWYEMSPGNALIIALIKLLAKCGFCLVLAVSVKEIRDEYETGEVSKWTLYFSYFAVGGVIFAFPQLEDSQISACFSDTIEERNAIFSFFKQFLDIVG